VIKRQKKNLQKELEDYKQVTNEAQHLAEEFQRSRNLPNLDLVSWKRKIRNYERTVKEARERLEQAREQAAKQIDEETGKIEKEFTESLKNMHIDFEKSSVQME
jgi:cyclopropane fatty-acyl-phospholipid synthase-like methyltransferase